MNQNNDTTVKGPDMPYQKSDGSVGEGTPGDGRNFQIIEFSHTTIVIPTYFFHKHATFDGASDATFIRPTNSNG